LLRPLLPPRLPYTTLFRSFAYLGTPYVLGGWRKFNFRLTSTPLPDLLSGLLGLIVGLVVAVLIGAFVRDIQPYGIWVSAVLALLDRKSTRLNSSHGSISYA